MDGVLTNMICIFYNIHALFYERDDTIHNDSSQIP